MKKLMLLLLVGLFLLTSCASQFKSSTGQVYSNHKKVWVKKDFRCEF